MSSSILGYQIGQHKLDLLTKTLSFNNANIEIAERGFLFLCELAKASPELVSKEHLHRALWPDRQVSDWALARVVSDTRLLLEKNGEQQELIKTARGLGYSLKNCTAIINTEKSNESDPIIKRNSPIFFKIISLVIVFMVVLFATYNLNNYLKEKSLVAAISKIAKCQTYTFSAFQAQSKRRDELVKHIEQRLQIKRSRQFEKFFVHFYPQMNKEEHFIFSQIRGITESNLYTNNSAIYKTLENNQQIYKLIPKTKALAKHLQFWLSKYRSVFLKRQDMGLLYVGVEDGVPYPSKVDQQIKNWLKKHK